jgi:hypothetical protein
LGNSYNFWANLPENIESAIEGRSENDIQDWIARTEARLRPLRSPLLAEESVDNASLSSPSFNIHSNSTFQIGSSQNSAFQTQLFQKGSTQVSRPEIGSIHQSLTQTSTSERGTTQVDSSKVGLSQLGTSQATFLQISSAEGRLQVSPFQPRITQVNVTPISFQLSPAEIDATQVNSWQSIGINIHTSKNTFSLGIAAGQLIDGHGNIPGQSGHWLTPNSQFSSTTVPTWLSYLGGTTPFNLNIEVTDLPTGQLAEAQLTGFDANGKPNAGTLLLDHNGNDLGWF